MEFIKAIEVYDRMCNKNYPECSKCEIVKQLGTELDCSDLLIHATVKIEKILKQWVKDNPIKTYKNKEEI